MSMAATSPWLAVAAGMLTVGAPCVLPMLPVVLGASVARGPAQRTRPLFIALGFALSFAAVALLFSSFTQVLGVSLGAVWTPCAGPVLASILTLIATEPPGVSTAVLLLAYSTGAALPMLAIAYGGQAAASHVRRISRHAHRVQQVFGVVVIAVALAMLLEVDGQVTAWLSQFYPSSFGGL